MTKKFLAALLLAFLPLALIISSASAHTSVVQTTPTYKSTLSEMPKEITIEFTDQLMQLAGSTASKNSNSISITAPDSTEIENIMQTVSQNQITATLPDLNYLDGTYVVSYRVVSADGHPVSGSYELYLNTPSSKKPALHEDSSHSFLHIHQTHLIQAGLVLILISLWWGYRRFNKEQGE